MYLALGSPIFPSMEAMSAVDSPHTKEPPPRLILMSYEKPDPRMSSPRSPDARASAEWIGKRLRIGGAVLSIRLTCPRCVMTTHGFADLPRDPRIMRRLVKAASGNLGVYGVVETPGDVRRGDSIQLLDG